MFATDALDATLDLAVHAEAAGFDRVWTTEYVGRDACVRALAVAMRTSNIEVGTGVAYAFTRAPLAMAALASDIQKIARGRFSLGISPGTRGVRRWYDAEFDPPAPRLVQYVEQLRTIWEADSSYAGAPLFAPAFNPIMTRHAARVCDGLLLHPLAAGEVHFFERVLPAMRTGAQQRERPPELVAWRVTSIHADEETARRNARGQLAFYFSTPSYEPVVADTPWEDVPATIRERFAASDGTPQWKRIGEEIPDDMLDEFTLTATPEQAHGRLQHLQRRLEAQGITEIGFQTVGAGLDDDEVATNCRHIIDALGPGTTQQTTHTEDQHHG
ncbi:LLM class flavin-dependent oxidoreductase [Nocardioides sp.]|uniref:LLM class flavin-dependent oxidoreductase n=1 Tax=Nocardioides sp. TaxID=35761 RepID=UPI00321B9709